MEGYTQNKFDLFNITDKEITLILYIFTRIGSITKDLRLMAISDKVLNMSHFMMHCDKIFVVHLGAHFNSVVNEIHFNIMIYGMLRVAGNLPIIMSITKIPSRWLTQDRTIWWLLNNGINPEISWQNGHVDGLEEVLGQLEHHMRCVSLGQHCRSHLEEMSSRIGNR